MQSVALVIPPPHAATAHQKRLQATGALTTLVAWENWSQWVQPNPQQVLCLHESALDQIDWPKRRVQLAEAGRFFILLSDTCASRKIVQALRDGAYEALNLKDEPERWLQALAATAEAERLWQQLYGANLRSPEQKAFVGASPTMDQLRETIRRIGPTQASVLLQGESGAGKERVAQALHASGSGGSFVAINCAAIPRDLLEAELFGVTKGAFTGAHTDRPGLLEQAAGGTLFLDEIGELDLSLQPKLLRFLETRQARRIGGRTEYAVDVRIISATNVDLREKMAKGTFREDLFYRLAEFTLAVPPLRQHLEDIPGLVRQFLDEEATRHGKVVTGIEPALIQKLQAWSWPGNVRELRSAVKRMVILANSPVLGAGAWEPPLPSPSPPPANAQEPAPAPTSSAPLSRRQKRELAFRLLAEHHGDQAWVAAQLAIHPTTLYRWRKQAGMK